MKTEKKLIGFLVLILSLMGLSLGMAVDYGIAESFKSGIDRAESSSTPEQVDPLFAGDFDLDLGGESLSVSLLDAGEFSYTMTIVDFESYALNDSFSVDAPEYQVRDRKRLPIGSVFSCPASRAPVFSESILC